MKRRIACHFWIASVACATAQAQFGARTVPVVDATNDRVLTFEDFDGRPAALSIDLAAVGALDPVEALTISISDLWVSDRTTDSIYRLGSNGSLLGTISTGLDDIRGMNAGANRVYVANRGSANGAPGPAIVMFDFNGNNLGSFPVTDPEDVYWIPPGDLLVGNVGGHDLDRYATDGTYLGKFHDSDGVTGLDAPEQIVRNGCRGRLLCAAGGARPGIYELDAGGNQIGYFPRATDVRGVQVLRDGNWLFTDANGVHVRDFATGTTIDVLTGIDARFIGESDPELPQSYAFCWPSLSVCPCGNNAPAACLEGCLNSLGVGASLQGGGAASLAADTLALAARGLPGSAPVLFFQGTTMQNGGNGSAFGDGLRCAGGSVVRLATKFASNGSARYPQAGDASISVRGLVSSPGVRTYQAWYRNSASFCTTATFNLSNGWYVTWFP